MQPLADKLGCAGVWRHVRFVLSGQGQEHVTDVLESVKLIHVYSNRGYMLIYYDLVVSHMIYVNLQNSFILVEIFKYAICEVKLNLL